MAYLIAALFLLPLVSMASPSSSRCTGRMPLLSVELDHVSLNQSPIVLGEWHLPATPLVPDQLTEARVRLVLVRLPEKEGPGWKVEAYFDFPDPKPFGIPFSFEGFRLTWYGEPGRVGAEVDWSDFCVSPGRSVFPWRHWTSTVELPETPTGRR